jgi:2,4-diaminopentanoate dehydrogenase
VRDGGLWMTSDLWMNDHPVRGFEGATYSMAMTNSAAPLRVIQWTTGNIGQRSLHAIIGRPDMELVGVYAHGSEKVGKDAAELSGWPEPTGIQATNDIDALIALKPDACCYNPLWPNVDELVRLLEAGINVCSSAAWITGGKQTPEDRERIQKACIQGNSTMFGSGAHPGMSNLVGMVLSGSCERVDEIRITESVDCSTYESAETQKAMGFSQPPDTPGLAESVRRESEVFAESAAMMADAMGVKLDKLTFDVTFTAATGDSDLGFMQIPKDTVAGVFGYHRGWVGDRNIVNVGFNWIMGSHVEPPKPLEHGHVVQVFGLPNMRTVLHCLPPKDWKEPGFMGLGMIYTALPVTNAVPKVVAAKPGIVTLADLPPITGRPAV